MYTKRTVVSARILSTPLSSSEVTKTHFSFLGMHKAVHHYEHYSSEHLVNLQMKVEGAIWINHAQETWTAYYSGCACPILV